jgi:hypothetical protein
VKAHDKNVLGLAFDSLAPHVVATFGEDDKVKLWDIRHINEPVRFAEHFFT